MKKDIILIVDGGCLLGVFALGALSVVKRFNLYPRIHSIYSVSAGAFNSAYFLTKQMSEGIKIYFDKLSGDKFVKNNRLLNYVVSVLITGNCDYDFIDVDYVMDVVSKQEPLNISLLKKSKIPLFVRVFNLKKQRYEYFDARKNSLNVLHATSTASPFYTKSVKLGDDYYIDGRSIHTNEFINIIKLNPDKKIIYIVNERNSFFKILFLLPYYVMESCLHTRLFGLKTGIRNLLSCFNLLKNKEISKYDNVILIENLWEFPKTFTSNSIIRRMFFHGIKQGEKALKKALM